MPAYVIGNFLLFCVVNAFTPGPGNILALNTVTNYGLSKGRPLFSGIFAGYYAVELICAFFVYGIGSFLPNVLGVLKYVGAIYILWLALHIAINKPTDISTAENASFWKGFTLQFVNIKIYLFGITALTGYVTDYSMALTTMIGAVLFIATLGTVATSTWIGIGALLQKTYLKYYRPINIALSLTLLNCALGMLN